MEEEGAEEEKVETVREEEKKEEGVREEEGEENKPAVAEKAVEKESKQVAVAVVKVMGVYKLAVEERKNEGEEAIRAPTLEMKVVEGTRSE